MGDQEDGRTPERPQEDDEIIDAEVVELSGPEPIEANESEREGQEVRARYLPAVRRDTGPRDWSDYAEPERQCRAHKKTGEQCRNAAILGSTVCRYHGGAARHVKAAARARIDNTMDLVAKKLITIALLGDNEAVQVQALRDLLDRGGLKAPTQVVVSPGEQAPYQQVFDSIGGGSRAASRAARGMDRGDDVPLGESSATPGSGSQTLWFDEVYTGEGGLSGPEAGDFDRLGRDPAPPRFDREVDAEDAVRRARAANAGVRAIESPHKRYRRP